MSGLTTPTAVVRQRPRRHRPEPRRRGLLLGGLAVVVIVAVLAAGLVIWRWQADEDIASGAGVTASSTARGFVAADVVTGSVNDPGKTWQSDGQTVGAWVELAWSSPHVVHQIAIVRPRSAPGVTDGFLTFGDGSTLQLRLSTTQPVTLVPLTPREVDRVRFTASAVDEGARSVTIAELRVMAGDGAGEVVSGEASDGNAATKAVLDQSADAGASDVRALQDGAGQATAQGAGADWTVTRPVGAWVQLNWDRPRELAAVELVGSLRSSAALAKATLTFSDGAQMPVAAVLGDPTRPTIVAFMPRVTTSVRLRLDEVSGSGALALGEVRAYERGTTAARSSAGSVTPTASGASGASAVSTAGTPAAPATCSGPSSGARPSGLVVDCPPAGSTVDDSTTMRVRVPTGYTSVTATVWRSDGVGTATSAPSVPDAAGDVFLPVVLSTLPAGPFFVSVDAQGAGQPAKSVFFPLYRRGTPPGDVGSSAGARGRSLAYAEEFDRPVTISRTGTGADYASSKPTPTGVQDFGDAAFADPARDPDVFGVADDRFLRIDVKPAASDPAGYHRAYVGGLLSSARPGGSGFSAQYGYFEARMLAPASPGTWPAFWMLPADGLVAPAPDSGAEIDATEMHGQFPDSACHSTHQYEKGHEVGGVALCGQRFPSNRAAMAWHTYGVAVNPSENVFYIDGTVVATAPQVAGGGSPMFFMVDLALGGGWPVDLQGTQNRSTLYVDYVRVYV